MGFPIFTKQCGKLEYLSKFHKVRVTVLSIHDPQNITDCLQQIMLGLVWAISQHKLGLFSCHCVSDFFKNIEISSFFIHRERPARRWIGCWSAPKLRNNNFLLCGSHGFHDLRNEFSYLRSIFRQTSFCLVEETRFGLLIVERSFRWRCIFSRLMFSFIVSLFQCFVCFFVFIFLKVLSVFYLS